MEQFKTCSNAKLRNQLQSFANVWKSKDKLQFYWKKCKSNHSYRKKYGNDKYANDETYRLAKKLRNRLRKALLRQLTQKNDKTEDLLGISFKEFKEYIECFNDFWYWDLTYGSI